MPSTSIQKYQVRIEQYLAKHLPSDHTVPKRLHTAMRYSVLNGGKRIRPLLVYALGSACNAEPAKLDAAAAAVEVIHCYSLIHDDLPAMDDDDLRRGKPTCHKAFDEATAILAGDALQALAFEFLVRADSLTDKQIIKMIEVLAIACGSQGMAGGQALDLEATGKSLNLTYVENMHAKKTGALITASCVLGAIAGSVSEATLANIKRYGDLIGLAFQIQDDVLDIEGFTEILGKTQGADSAAAKLTYPAVTGLQEAKNKVETLYQAAIKELSALDLNTPFVQELSDFLIQRIK